jgi:hypothetical protein
MGGSLASACLAAANDHPAESESALAVYQETKYDHLRQVDVNSHWIGLALLLIILGIVFDRLERMRLRLALDLLTGWVAAPLGVFLETGKRARDFAAGLAVVSSAMVIGTPIALGFTPDPGPNPT